MARAKKKKEEVLDEVALSSEAALDEQAAAAEDDAAIEDAVIEDDGVTEEVTLAASEEETAAADAETAVDGEAVAADDAAPEIPAEDLALTQEDVRLVEAILFASATAVTVGMIAERFPKERVSLIPDVLEYLKEQYASRGVTLVQRENRWALRTASDLGDQLRLEKEQPKKFTRAAMETMAIVAYHQPVTRAEIENIRGVATSPGALDALMEAGWIKPGKRREVPGRPVTWLSTQAFLDHFGLEKLEDLPGMEELKAAGLLDKRPAVEAMPTADMFGDGEAKAEHDPQEVTDEDLIGKVTEGDETVASLDAVGAVAVGALAAAGLAEDAEDEVDADDAVSENSDTASGGDDEDEEFLGDEDDFDEEDDDEESDDEESDDEDDEDSDDEDEDDEESDDEDDESDSDDDDDADEDDEDGDDEDDDEDDEDEDEDEDEDDEDDEDEDEDSDDEDDEDEE
ncbi:MAG: SMC-Scp complex subunit ScpB [Micavibrio sp.]|nr:SMC-Scp complex subunit ScpB [Micavibrio sp.]